MPENEGFEHWAILELMGHRRLAGFVRTVELAGASMIRLDVPSLTKEQLDSLPVDIEGCIEEHWEATQFYNPSAVYCLTPCSEETARKVVTLSRPTPVQQWELPAPRDVPASDDDYRDDF